MILEFVRTFDENRDNLRNTFKEKHIGSYFDLVKIVIKMLSSKHTINPNRIFECVDGEYTGAMIYIIGGKNIAFEYYFLVIRYGSCGFCDTLKNIHCGMFDTLPTEQDVEDYMLLALHIVQEIKFVG